MRILPSYRGAAAAGIAVLALTLGACGSDDEALSSSDREKASAAALKHVGGGAVTDAERGDGDDPYAYEVEVTLPGGTDIDVELDESFTVVNNPPTAAELAASAPTGSPTTTSPTDAAPTAVAPDDDRGLLGDTKRKAEAAALKATGEGRVVGTSGSDDADHVFEVDVLLPDGRDVTVELDGEFDVTRIDR